MLFRLDLGGCVRRACETEEMRCKNLQRGEEQSRSVVSKTSVYQLDLTESSHKGEGLRSGRSLPP